MVKEFEDLNAKVEDYLLGKMGDEILYKYGVKLGRLLEKIILKTIDCLFLLRKKKNLMKQN